MYILHKLKKAFYQDINLKDDLAQKGYNKVKKRNIVGSHYRGIFKYTHIQLLHSANILISLIQVPILTPI
jgi:hypothetical protein